MPRTSPLSGSLVAVLAGSLALTTAAHGTPRVDDAPVIRTEARDLESATAPLRIGRTVTVTPPKAVEAVWDSFLRDHGPWEAMWDEDTQAPVRMWGRGIAAPGANALPDVAATAARELLRTHLALIAPGASLGDFELITNQVHGGLHGQLPMRTVAFAQRIDGAPVLGGSVGFLFKNDRVIVINSTAIAHPRIAPPAIGIAPVNGLAKARAWVEATLGAPTTVLATDATVRLLPMVHADRSTSVHAVVSLDIDSADAAHPGRWRVFVDATSGALVARQSLIKFAAGTISYRVPTRSPQRPRTDVPAPFGLFSIGGNQAVTDAAGVVTWTGTSPVAVTTGVTGRVVRVRNSAGTPATATLNLAPDGVAVWDRSTVGTDDAQLTTFIAVNTVKAYAQANLNPGMPYLDEQLSATVNEADTCNANSTGDDIHFYRASTRCENTGRIADVVYHEFGHSLHFQSIVPGVGNFDGGLSEGVSDYLAATITNDAGMGRGFFFNDAALRNLDPSRDKRWPTDATGEVHDDGEIIGGTLWDVRKAMIATYGDSLGVTKADDIYYAIISRATDIPTTFVEALAHDDDDGDLANGTPNLCLLRQVFSNHGLAIGAGVAATGLGNPVVDTTDGSLHVQIPVGAPVGGCAAPTIGAGTITWKLRGSPTLNSVPMTRDGDNLIGTIPPPPDGSVLEWGAAVDVDGTSMRFPDNLADSRYQIYVGAVEPIYCADFESDPAWTHGGVGDSWEWAAPTGGAGDPRTATSGGKVFGTAITDGVGAYRPGSAMWARMPRIDTSGYAVVRLQYKRWLNVEDGHFDQAKITADNHTLWTNFDSNNGDNSHAAHRDREWRFHDVDLTADAADGSVQLEFSLASDEALELGGWNIDDLCVVGLRSPPGACGNQTIDGTEQCDDGNLANGDGCSATCAIEDGAGTDDGGCCSTGSRPAGTLVAIGLGAIVSALGRRRRRARVTG